MKPHEVKLTLRQKVVPFLKTVRDVFPWQFILIAAITIASVWYLPPMLMTFKAVGGKLIAQRIIVGLIVTLCGWFLLGVTAMFLADIIIPIREHIARQYQKHSLDKKKEVLDNIIEDEVL